jgi:hypothetical protein
MQNEKMQNNIIKLPISELIAGIVVTLGFFTFILMMLLFPNDTTVFWVFLEFGFGMTMGIVLILSWFIWRVEYNDEVFIYRNKLGHKTTVPYSSINKARLAQNAIHLYANSRKYTIYRKSKGEDGFFEVLSKQLQDNVEIVDRLLR